MLALIAYGATQTINQQDDPIISSVDLDSADVGAVLDLLATTEGLSYSASPDILSLPIGRLRLKNCRVSEVLNYIAQQSGLQWRRDERGVYIITKRTGEPLKPSEAKETEKPVPTPPKVLSPEEQSRRLESGQKEPIVTDTIKLKHIPVADICFLLGIPIQGISPYQMILQDFTNRQLTGTLPILGRRNQRFKVNNNPIVPETMTLQTMSNLASNWGSSLQSSGTLETARQFVPGGFGGFPGGVGGFVGGVGGFPGGVGGFPGGIGGFPGGVGGFPGGGFGGFGGLGFGGAFLSALIPGIQNIVGLPAQNILLVWGTPEAIQTLREILKEIDVPPNQVEIESQFVEVSGTLQDIYGIDWSVTGREVTVVTGLGAPATPTISIGFVRGSLSASIGALLTRSKGKVIQAPRAFTINGLPVFFISVIERPVIIQDVIYVPGPGGTLIPQTVTEIDIFPVQISLTAVPFINADNTVTVFIIPIVQDIPEFVPNPIGGTIPVISTTFTQALVRVRDGESFAIGGVLRTRNSQARREVPLLARLPFIGSLFKTKTQDVDEKNLVIFVTPRILRAEEITPVELGG